MLNKLKAALVQTCMDGLAERGSVKSNSEGLTLQLLGNDTTGKVIIYWSSMPDVLCSGRSLRELALLCISW